MQSIGVFNTTKTPLQNTKGITGLKEETKAAWRRRVQQDQLETALDPRTQEVVNAMPEWHQDINRNTLIPLFGQHFKFFGIDPVFPDRIILEIKEPTGKGKKWPKNK